MNPAFVIILLSTGVMLSNTISYYSDHEPKRSLCLPEVLAVFLGRSERRMFEPFKENSFVKDVCPGLSYSCCREEDIRFLLDQFNMAKKKLEELKKLHQIAVGLFKDLKIEKMREFIDANRNPKVNECIGEELKYTANLTLSVLEDKITSRYLKLALDGIYGFYASFICEICSLDVYTYLDNPTEPASIRFNKVNYMIAFQSIANLMHYHKRIYPMYQIAKVGLCLQDPSYTLLEIEKKTPAQVESDRTENLNCYNSLPRSSSLACLKRSGIWDEFSNNTITSSYFLYLQRIIDGLTVLKIEQGQTSHSLKSAVNVELLKGVIEFYERNERSDFSFDSLTIELVEEKAWNVVRNQMNPKYWKGEQILQTVISLVLMLGVIWNN